jgi:hypothetical protein
MNATFSYVGITALLSFFISVGAAVFAINLYSLLRTGRVGASWRVLIIATVMFALGQAVRLAEIFGVPLASDLHLSSVIELAFVISLLYAFYLQRQVFENEKRREDTGETGEEEELEDATPVSVYERYS